MLRIDDIFKLFADRMTIAQIMVVLDEAVKQFFRYCAANLTKSQGLDVRQFSLNRAVINGDFRRLCAVDKRVVDTTLFGRQPNIAGAVKLKHQASAHHIFKCSVGLNPIPGTAKLFR